LQNPGSVRAEPTPWQIKTRDRRLNKLAEVTLLTHSGMSMTAAVSEARLSYTTFWMLRKRYALHGPDGLLPRISKGRPPQIDPRLYTEELVSHLQRLATKLGGSRAACRVFANSASCPEPLGQYINQRDAVPDALRRLIGFRYCTATIRRAGSFFYIERLGPDLKAA